MTCPVFRDADLEQAVSWAAFGLYFNAGCAYIHSLDSNVHSLDSNAIQSSS